MVKLTDSQTEFIVKVMQRDSILDVISLLENIQVAIDRVCLSNIPIEYKRVPLYNMVTCYQNADDSEISKLDTVLVELRSVFDFHGMPVINSEDDTYPDPYGVADTFYKNYWKIVYLYEDPLLYELKMYFKKDDTLSQEGSFRSQLYNMLYDVICDYTVNNRIPSQPGTDSYFNCLRINRFLNNLNCVDNLMFQTGLYVTISNLQRKWKFNSIASIHNFNLVLDEEIELKSYLMEIPVSFSMILMMTIEYTIKKDPYFLTGYPEDTLK